MILDKEIQIRVNSTTLKHYRDLGYKVNNKEIIFIKVEDLTPSTGYKINVKCDVCGNEKLLSYHDYLKNIKNTGIYCCSNKCAYEVKNKKTYLEKYGVENYYNKEKCKKTCLEKYGVESVFQIQEIKEKIKKNNLEKYGDESHNRSDAVKERKKETFLKKYGVNCNLNTEEQKEKSRIKKLEKFGNLNNHDQLKSNFIEKYGVEHPSMVKEFKEKRIKNYKKTIINNILSKYKEDGIIEANFDDDKFVFNCEKGHIFEINRNLLKSRVRCKTILCTVCNPISIHISGQEILFNNFIKESYNDEIIFNSKNIINPYELDVYLPKLKLAFEFNGIFWHDEYHRDNNYHFKKTEICEENEIRLIHVYEDDWIYKQEIIKSMILNFIDKFNKIDSDNCDIKEINEDELIKDFLNKNHLKGEVESDIKIGLFYKNELINLILFKKINFNKSDEKSYEILRFCNKLNINIIDGYKKIFYYFINKYKPDEVSYCVDRSWSDNDFYEKLNFKLIDRISPDYMYIVKGLRKHKSDFYELIKEEYNKNQNKTEHEIMQEKRIYRIYDSGYLKYSWKNNFIYNN